MARTEKTTKRMSTKAAKVLAGPGSSSTAKSLAGSALTQAHRSKQTSGKLASKAGKALASKSSGKTVRRLAGSVLTQREDKRTSKSTKSSAGSALTQHVSTRRTDAGKSERRVLTPISSGSLDRTRVAKVVAHVLSAKKKA